MEEKDFLGARRAIQRRVLFELGCNLGAIDELKFMGKIFYSAECDDDWGENEIDYCFFIQKDFQEDDFKPSRDEIERCAWVGRDEILPFLRERYQNTGETITPWFGAIIHYSLFKWWDNLIEGSLDRFIPDPGIVNLNPFQLPLFREQNSKVELIRSLS